MKMMLPHVIGHENQSQHYQHHRCLCLGAVHKVRHAIFGQFLPPPPVTLRHTSRGPSKVRHTSRTPRFLEGLVHKPGQKPPCTNSVSIVHRGVCPGGFVKGSFV